jgi:transcriptional regulator with XRE-family HTH domain
MTSSIERERLDVDAVRDRERRRRLSAFLLAKRRGVAPSVTHVGDYARRENRVGGPFLQDEIAEALGVSMPWYAALELGSSIRPTSALLDRTATLFALSDEERVTLFRLGLRESVAPLDVPRQLAEAAAPSTYAAAPRSPAEIDDAAYELARIRERYHLTGAAEGGAARPRIVESWDRCRTFGVDPDTKRAPVHENVDELREANARLLRAADPILVYLADAFAGTGYAVIVSDAHGVLLDLAGDLDVRRTLSRLEYEVGNDWSEAAAGSNAIGTSIVDNRALQMFAAEHFCEGAVSFTCTAAPIYDPETRAITGVLDISGSYRLARPHLIGVVMQFALEIEERLGLL